MTTATSLNPVTANSRLMINIATHASKRCISTKEIRTAEYQKACQLEDPETSQDWLINFFFLRAMYPSNPSRTRCNNKNNGSNNLTIGKYKSPIMITPNCKAYQ